MVMYVLAPVCGKRAAQVGTPRSDRAAPPKHRGADLLSLPRWARPLASRWTALSPEWMPACALCQLGGSQEAGEGSSRPRAQLHCTAVETSKRRTGRDRQGRAAGGTAIEGAEGRAECAPVGNPTRSGGSHQGHLLTPWGRPKVDQDLGLTRSRSSNGMGGRGGCLLLVLLHFLLRRVCPCALTRVPFDLNFIDKDSIFSDLFKKSPY